MWSHYQLGWLIVVLAWCIVVVGLAFGAELWRVGLSSGFLFVLMLLVAQASKANESTK